MHTHCSKKESQKKRKKGRKKERKKERKKVKRKKESKEKERKARRVKLEGYLNKIEKAERELHKLKRKEVLNTKSEKGNNNIEFKINKEKK